MTKTRSLFTRSGFTLIELIVVIAIIGVLMTMGLVSFSKASESARNGRRKADLEQVRSALVLYRTDSANGRYPASITWTTMAPISSYISVSSMSDPKASPHPQYQYTYDASANSFTLCATLENVTPANYCLRNP